MKVLFLVNIPSPYRVDFFNELGKKCNLSVAFEGRYATDRDEKWKGKESTNFTPIFLRGIRIRTDAFLCLDVFSIIKKEWDAIVIGGYSTPTTMLAIEYLRLHKIPFYLEVDGGFVKKESNFKFQMKKHFVSAASAWLSTGKKTNEYLEHYGARKEKIYIYPFSSLLYEDFFRAHTLINEKTTKLEIDSFREKCDRIVENKDEICCINQWKKNRSAINSFAKSKLNIQEKTVVLAVGQFIYRKGFDILLKAVELFDLPIGVFLVGGKAPLEYEEIIKQRNLKNVHIVEFKKKEELALYYQAADVFVLPTREDIWGLVINEAMAYGVPVITTEKCIAGLELIKQYENGCIVPRDNVSELKKAIKDVIRLDSNLDLSFNSFYSIYDYTIENMADSHIEIFEKNNS